MQEDFCSCPICLTEYDLIRYIPLVSSCGHSFCEICSQEIFRRDNTCPICRRDIISPLSRNIALMSFLESSISSKENNDQLKQYLTAQYEYTEIKNALHSTDAIKIGKYFGL